MIAFTTESTPPAAAFIKYHVFNSITLMSGYSISCFISFGYIILLEPLVTSFWISGDVSSGVSKPEWVLNYSHCGGEFNVHPLRTTSGATPANLLIDSIAGSNLRRRPIA